MSISSSSLNQLSKTERTERNRELYDGWAPVYDIDGNALPLVDDVIFNERVVPLMQAGSANRAIRVLDIGCGTGRNTAKLPALLSQEFAGDSAIYAVDVSEGMIKEAKRKLEGSSVEVELRLLDFHTQGEELAQFVGDPVDIVISTLVLGHVELDAFFATVGRHLKRDGWAWVTTMHPSIGKITEAGYRRANGLKVGGVTVNYEIDEIVDAAKKGGLEVEGDIVEAGVGSDEAEAVANYGERARKWAGYKIFAGIRLIKSAIL